MKPIVLFASLLLAFVDAGFFPGCSSGSGARWPQRPEDCPVGSRLVRGDVDLECETVPCTDQACGEGTCRSTRLCVYSNCPGCPEYTTGECQEGQCSGIAAECVVALRCTER